VPNENRVELWVGSHVALLTPSLAFSEVLGDLCDHSEKRCTYKGKLNEAIQCDLCYT